MAYSKIPLGDSAPKLINVIIEIPRGSHNKYEYDEDFDEIKLDRVLHSPLFYPADYGFAPETHSDDGDHLDVLVIISDPVFPGCIVSARPIGVLDMEDDGGQDWKILAVADKDPRLTKYQSIEDIDEQYKNEITHFFTEYKKLENKKVTVKGWLGKEEALQRITHAAQEYVQLSAEKQSEVITNR